MEILKHGDMKPRRFKCNNCNCEFVADMSEYEEVYHNCDKYYAVHCPDCKYYVSVVAFASEIYDGHYMTEAQIREFIL